MEQIRKQDLKSCIAYVVWRREGDNYAVPYRWNPYVYRFQNQKHWSDAQGNPFVMSLWEPYSANISSYAYECHNKHNEAGQHDQWPLDITMCLILAYQSHEPIGIGMTAQSILDRQCDPKKACQISYRRALANILPVHYRGPDRSSRIVKAEDIERAVRFGLIKSPDEYAAIKERKRKAKEDRRKKIEEQNNTVKERMRMTEQNIKDTIERIYSKKKNTAPEITIKFTSHLQTLEFIKKFKEMYREEAINDGVEKLTPLANEIEKEILNGQVVMCDCEKEHWTDEILKHAEVPVETQEANQTKAE